MYDSMKNNSNRCNSKKINYVKNRFQSYNLVNFGETVTTCSPISCNIQQICRNNEYKFNKYILNQQNLYTAMRWHPEKFPITSYVQNMNLKEWEQRKYSNYWYRQFGTSQALPANDNWGGFTVVGSEVPYTS